MVLSQSLLPGSCDDSVFFSTKIDFILKRFNSVRREANCFFPKDTIPKTYFTGECELSSSVF